MRKYLSLLAVFFLLTACKSSPRQDEFETAENTAVPDIKQIEEPQFTITSITILQADLINTRLKLTLKIDNPNIIPITLSSFHYELYGNNRFWASGTEEKLVDVPAQGISEAEFEIEMNFSNMRRKLLDDIIALREVHYRIVGYVDVKTGLSHLPDFRMNFDYSGDSEVIK